MAYDKYASRSNFVAFLEKAGGNVSIACSAFNISRKCYYRWRKKDAEFAEACDDVTEACLDDVENALFESAMRGNVRAGVFILSKRRREQYGQDKIDAKGIVEKFKDMDKDELIKFIVSGGKEMEQQQLEKKKT
jgi:hypothetical protein